MIFRLYFVLVGISTAATIGKTQPYLTRLADTFIQNGVEPNHGYQQATLYLGIEKAYELSKDKKYLDWYKGQIDGHVVQENGTIKDWSYDFFSVDDYRMGNTYLYLYSLTGDEKYKAAAAIVRKQLSSHPRTPSGGFW